MESIECYQEMHTELGEDMNIHNERVQWELSECSHELCNQRLAEHGTQVSKGDVQTGWRSSARLRWNLGATMKPPNISQPYCFSTQCTGWISS